MKIKTMELTGAALDWAVATAQGWRFFDTEWRGAAAFDGDELGALLADESYSPSTNWTQGGPLIEQFEIGFLPPCASPCSDKDAAGDFIPWAAAVSTHPDLAKDYGRTPLIAACRAIVAEKLGEEVDVPEELMGPAV